MKIVAILLMILITLTSCSNDETKKLPNNSKRNLENSQNDTVIVENNTDNEVKEYIKQNIVSVSDENIADMFKTIDIDKYDIIFTGDTHGISNSYKVKTELIKYLTENWNLKYIISELGFAEGEYLNLYFQTGDEKYLTNFISDSKGLSSFTYEEYNYYKNIYAYNSTLSDDKKLRIIGVDAEKNLKTAFRYIDYIFKDSANKPNVMKIISQLANTDDYSNTNIWEKHSEEINTIISDFEENQEIYKDIFAKQYQEYYFIINNISGMNNYVINTNNYIFGTNALDIKENQIAYNFKSMYKYIGNNKIYGDFCSPHILQESNSHFMLKEPFVKKLIEEQVLDLSKICSIDIQYENSQMLLKNKIYNTSIIRTKEEYEVLDNLKNNYSILKVAGENSPFYDAEKTSNYFFYYTKPSSSFVQHIIFIKQSPASTPYSAENYNSISKINIDRNKLFEDFYKQNVCKTTDDNINDLLKCINIEQYDIIARGESHGTKANYLLDYNLIKYLSENWNLKYILVEYDFANISYLDNYLNTGNTEFLKKYVLTSPYPKDQENFYKKIYEYNSKLPKDKKLHIIGMGLAINANFTFEYLDYLITNINKPIPKEINIISDFKRYSSYSDYDLWFKYKGDIKMIINSFYDNKEIYKEFLGDKYDEYSYIMDNLNGTYNAFVENRMLFETTEEGIRAIDKQMEKNFNSIYSKIKDSKIYIVNGNNHILKEANLREAAYYIPYFAKAIKENEIDESKICCIQTRYLNSQANYNKEYLDIDFSHIPEYKYISDKLNGNYAIIKPSEKFLRYDTAPFCNPESSYYDHVFITKNSKPAE